MHLAQSSNHHLTIPLRYHLPQSRPRPASSVLFQDSPEPNQVSETSKAAVKADTTVSSICRAADNRSRITLPGTLGTCFVSPSLLSSPATMGCCPYSRNSSWTAAVISAAVSFTSVSVSVVVSKLPDGVKARAKCPDGSLPSQESDTATSYCSSVLNPHLSPGQILEAYPDPAKWE